MRLAFLHVDDSAGRVDLFSGVALPETAMGMNGYDSFGGVIAHITESGGFGEIWSRYFRMEASLGVCCREN